MLILISLHSARVCCVLHFSSALSGWLNPDLPCVKRQMDQNIRRIWKLASPFRHQSLSHTCFGLHKALFEFYAYWHSVSWYMLGNWIMLQVFEPHDTSYACKSSRLSISCMKILLNFKNQFQLHLDKCAWTSYQNQTYNTWPPTHLSQDKEEKTTQPTASDRFYPKTLSPTLARCTSSLQNVDDLY